MTPYKKILVAVDLTEEAGIVMERACELRKHYGANLCLLHVVPPFPADGSYELGTAVMPADVEEEFVKRARDDVAALAKTMGVPDAPQTVTVGSVKHAILDYVEEEGCDLIVIGTHGRHGLAVLIGSTPNAVLHGTPCDVMCVRVGD